MPEPSGIGRLQFLGKNSFAESEHVDFREGLARQQVIADDGTDITETVEKAVAWLAENSF